MASADTLTFEAGSTTTLDGAITLNGASGNLLSLVSDNPGTRWNLTLNAGATKAISYVDVQDSDASGSDASLKPVNPADSVNSGNTVAWFYDLSIVKQLWETNGAAPLVSPATAPLGGTLVFLVYVKNPNASAVDDLRINDDLDEAGFGYEANSLVRTDAGAPPADTATDKQIFDATAPGTGSALSDAVDADVASAQNTGGPVDVDKITVGAVAGQANGSLTIPKNSTFGLRFEVTVK